MHTMDTKCLPENTSSADDAVDALLPGGVTPGALIEAMGDPTVFAEIARGDLYVHMAYMRQLAHNPAMPVAQRLEYMKALAKMGKVDQPDEAPLAAGANLPRITIVLPGVGQQVSSAQHTAQAPHAVIDVDE